MLSVNLTQFCNIVFTEIRVISFMISKTNVLFCEMHDPNNSLRIRILSFQLIYDLIVFDSVFERQRSEFHLGQS